MKKMKFLLGVAFVAISLFFMSCNPTGSLKITVTPTSVVASTGESVSFSTVVSPDAINNVDLGVFTISEGLDSTIYTYDFGGASNSDSVTFTYTVPANATLGSDIVLSFKIVDQNGNNPASTVATITVGTSLVTTSKTINYNSDLANSPLGLILNDDDAVVFTADQTVSPDLVYFAQNNYEHMVWSPDAQAIPNQDAYSTWDYGVTSANHTKIQKYTGDFSSLDADVLNALTITEESPDDYTAGGIGADHLAVDDVYVFETADGRKGAFKVTSASTLAKGVLYDSDITLSLVYTPASSGK